MVTASLPGVLSPGRRARDLDEVAGGDVDMVGGRSSLPSTRRVSADEVSRLVPGIRPGRGVVVLWDGQLVDDARLEVALARTAAGLLDRRTRFGLVPADRARAVPVAEQVLAEEP